MKKALCATIAVFMVFGLVSMAAAVVGNGETKASYLVWPKIVVNAEQDTVITIFNDFSSSTFLHCYWMDEFQNPQDFEFEITRFQTVWFKASDGSGMLPGRYPVSVPPFNGDVGELKCWAVNGNEAGANFDLPIQRNHLIGTGTIYNFVEGTAIGYNAYGFRKTTAGAAAGPELLLGVDYSDCPAYLLGTFMLAGASFEDQGYLVSAGTTEMTLAPCAQDLRQDRDAVFAKANLIVYDEDEVTFTNAYICFKCWVETTLEESPTVSGDYSYTNLFQNFTQAQVGGVFATVKVQPVLGTNSACDFPDGFAGPSTAVPFVGLIFGSQTITPLVAPVPPVAPLWVTAGGLMQQTSTPFAGAPYSVKYDRLGESQEMNNR